MEHYKTCFGGEIDIYPAENPLEATVIICPGGGYCFLSDREGEPVAKAFNQKGYGAVVLKYSLDKNPLGTQPVEELSWTVDQVRKGKYSSVSGKRIFLCGFSAGGHLAASYGAYWNHEAVVGVRKEESGVEGIILGYPVISSGKIGHRGSVKNMTGGDGSLKEQFSLEKQDLSQMPRTFIWNTFEDQKVPAPNSILFVKKLYEDGVSCEYHMFHRGLHGYSLATKEVECPEEGLREDHHIAHWFDLCLEWMKEGTEKKKI